MSTTADDILKKQFLKRFFRSGYDMDEVDRFLDEVAERVHQLSEENDTLQQQASDLQVSNAKHKEQESTFKNVLLSAQKVADDLVAQSQQKADGLLNEASEKIAQAQSEVEEVISNLQEEVDYLQNLRDTIRNELNKAIETFQLTLDNISKASPSYHFLDTPKKEEPTEFESSSEEESGLFEKIDIGDQGINILKEVTFETEEPVLDQIEDQEDDHEPDVFNGLDEVEDDGDKDPVLY